MRKAIFIAVLLVLVAVTAASASETAILFLGKGARSLGMGGTGIGTSWDCDAVNHNPANLGKLDIGYEGQPVDTWQFQGDFVFELDGEIDSWQTNWAANPVNKKWGLGFSYFDADLGGAPFDFDIMRLGIGYAYNEKLALGFSINDIDVFNVSETYFNIGLSYQMYDNKVVGLVIEDLTDALDVGGPFFSVGVGKRLSEELLLGVDLRDVSDELDRYWGAGVEYAPMSMPNLAVRAGMYEGGEMTFGAGWDAGVWAVDASYVEFSSDDSVTVSFSYKF